MEEENLGARKKEHSLKSSGGCSLKLQMNGGVGAVAERSKTIHFPFKVKEKAHR